MGLGVCHGSHFCNRPFICIAISLYRHRISCCQHILRLFRNLERHGHRFFIGDHIRGRSCRHHLILFYAHRLDHTADRRFHRIIIQLHLRGIDPDRGALQLSRVGGVCIRINLILSDRVRLLCRGQILVDRLPAVFGCVNAGFQLCLGGFIGRDLSVDLGDGDFSLIKSIFTVTQLRLQSFKYTFLCVKLFLKSRYICSRLRCINLTLQIIYRRLCCCNLRIQLTFQSIICCFRLIRRCLGSVFR